jgi:predicted DNA-binding transcriptional regulator AlpA
MQSDLYLTADQVAELLHISTRTLFNHVTNGVIPPPIRLGNRRLWPQQFLHDQVCRLPRKRKK